MPDTAAAVEALPSLPLGESFVTPTVTLAPVNLCHLGAISDTLDADSHSTEKRKNPANNKVFAGFSLIGPAGFEPTTSTTPTNKGGFENPAKHWTKCDDSERLHQCLHQIAKLVERVGLENLVEAIADSLEPDALERLADALNKRAERTDPKWV